MCASCRGVAVCDAFEVGRGVGGRTGPAAVKSPGTERIGGAQELDRLGAGLEGVVDGEQHPVDADRVGGTEQRGVRHDAAGGDVDVVPQVVRGQPPRPVFGFHLLEAAVEPGRLERQQLPHVPQRQRRTGELVEHAAVDHPERVGGHPVRPRHRPLRRQRPRPGHRRHRRPSTRTLHRARRTGHRRGHHGNRPRPTPDSGRVARPHRTQPERPSVSTQAGSEGGSEMPSPHVRTPFKANAVWP